MVDSRFPNVCNMCSLSLANFFVYPQTVSDFGYHSFGELVDFVYCILQRKRQRASLPLVEQWEQYVMAGHSKFAPIADRELLSGMRVLAALIEFGSLYLKREFKRDPRRFLEEFTNSVLSTVTARSKNWIGIELFLPCDRHWQRQPRAATFAWFFNGWAFGTRVDQRQ